MLQWVESRANFPSWENLFNMLDMAIYTLNKNVIDERHFNGSNIPEPTNIFLKYVETKITKFLPSYYKN